MKSPSEIPELPRLRDLWNPQPVAGPEPDLELVPDSWIERGVEVLVWWLARLEHWLSASGWLRAWLRLSLFLSVVLTSAGLLVLPPVVQVLQELGRSSQWLGVILGEVFSLVTRLPSVVVSLGVLYLGFVLYRRIRRRRLPHRGGYPQDEYYQ